MGSKNVVHSPAATRKPQVPAAGSQITSTGLGCTTSTVIAMMWRGVRNWPFWPAEAIFREHARVRLRSAQLAKRVTLPPFLSNRKWRSGAVVA
jgi:hypothetical protein